MKAALKQGGGNALNLYSTTAGDYLGWAYLPGITEKAGQRVLDGVVFDWESIPGTSTTYAGRYDQGETATHEVGHWLNLEHTFYGGCSAKGDFVDDTPAEKTPTSGCPAGKDTCTAPGLDPIHNYMEGKQYGNDPNLVTDSAGRVWMAWYSSDKSQYGVLAQQLGAGGEPGAAPPLAMPGTGDMYIGMQGRTPLAARAGGGVYVAYPAPQAQSQVRVWRVGAGNAPIVARKAGSGPVTLAAAGDGRLWAIWDDRGGVDASIHARRSNRGATRWGAEVAAGRPRGTLQAYRLDASAAGGAVDVLGVFNLGTSSNASTFHRRLLPGLTLAARPSKLRSGRMTSVTFTVRDAGAAVKGATVKAGGRSGTTDSKGRVELDLPGKAVTATATRDGYAKASKRLGRR